MKAEFNGLKHGARIRSAAPYLAIGGQEIEGDEHGSWFATCETSKSDVLLGICARSWSGRTLYSHLKLLAMSSGNLVGLLKLLHKAGDTSQLVIEIPEPEELDAAKLSRKPLAGLRIGGSWEKSRQASKLSYEEAINEYKKYSGPLKFGGELVRRSAQPDASSGQPASPSAR